MRSQRLAAEYRQQSRDGWDDGFDRLRWAKILDHLSEVFLADIEPLVESTFEGPVDTPPART